MVGGAILPNETASPTLDREGIALIKDFWRRVKKEKSGYFFVLPSLLLFVVFFIYPVFSGVELSFLHFRAMGGSTWAGSSNYAEVFKDPVFWIALKNTAIFAVAVVLCNITISTVLALMIISLPTKWQSLFKSMFYLPVIASGIVVALIWKWLFNPTFGLLNYLISFIGLQPVAWLGGPNTALPSLIFMTVAIGDGAAILLILASLGGISNEIYEAAACDGATGWKQFWRVTLPLLRPILLYLGVMSMINALQVFTPVFVMTRGGPNFATMTLAFTIYHHAFIEFMNFGIAAAQGVLLFLVTLVISLIQFRALRGEVTY